MLLLPFNCSIYVRSHNNSPVYKKLTIKDHYRFVSKLSETRCDPVWERIELVELSFLFVKPYLF